MNLLTISSQEWLPCVIEKNPWEQENVVTLRSEKQDEDHKIKEKEAEPSEEVEHPKEKEVDE